ncbi:MAG: hypothetical protein LBQ50_08145 [Planctomycetaceae bacterium]|jgi:hypothetical protein|nr:hypothetical protein [Planctomycetaceae bacterium]
MSYFQPLITSAFSSYSVSRSVYADRAAIRDNSVENRETSPTRNNVSDPDFGKPKSASGDILDLSQDVQKQYETKADNKKTENTETNDSTNSSDNSIALQAEEGETPETSESGVGKTELTPEEQQQVQELKARDQEVRTHEAAHVTAGGRYVTGGPTYTYQTGPDGKSYAVGGEVGIDTSEVSGDPAATIRKMQTVAAAALAPAQPSGQDQKVAAAAHQKEAQARAELSQQNNLVNDSVKESANDSVNDSANNPALNGSNEKEVSDSSQQATKSSSATGVAQSTRQSSSYQAQSSMPLSSTSRNSFSVFV